MAILDDLVFLIPPSSKRSKQPIWVASTVPRSRDNPETPLESARLSVRDVGVVRVHVIKATIAPEGEEVAARLEGRDDERARVEAHANIAFGERTWTWVAPVEPPPLDDRDREFLRALAREALEKWRREQLPTKAAEAEEPRSSTKARKASARATRKPRDR